MKEALEYLYTIQKELSVFSGVGSLLNWDQMTFMPPKGASERSEQIALISKLSHKRVISEKLWKHIEKLDQPSNFSRLSVTDQNVVKRLKKDVEKARKIPSDFVERISRVATLAYPAWEKAREKSNYKFFLPHLEKIIDLNKEYCGYIDLSGPRYNSLLDDYEEGMTVDRLKQEFGNLKSHLVEILNKIKDTDVYDTQNIFEKKIRKEIQRKLGNLVIKHMNLPKDRTRLDVSTHPFTMSIGYDDVRITTSYERPSALFSFFSTIHEAGHALYELNMPRDKYENTVISDSPSLGMHESQSRFWENMIARNKYFWKFFYPLFTKLAPGTFKDISLDEWYKIINQVRPSTIRVEADELTYCLHVILRFELELDIMENNIQAQDLPECWNEKSRELLGITPKNDKEGVLQDMHWSGGNFGYFPTYAIGSIYASQLFNKIVDYNPGVYGQLEKGDFTHILSWLNENIHRFGRQMTADEIIKNACGEGLNSGVFVDYLKDKYYQLYRI